MKQLIGIVVFILGFVWFPGTAVAQTSSATATATPWSGYWWPATDGELANGYRGMPAPLQKYDLVTNNVQTGPVTQFYLDHNYDPNAPDWYGLCDPYSAAAVLEAIDFKVSSVSNLYFYIGDKKGLLTYAYELSNTTGVSQPAGSPLDFHNWLLTYIGQQGLSFYADLDPSSEVWNHPIYKYEMDITDLGTEDYIACTIFYADDKVKPDYEGTLEQTRTYYYTLYKNENGYTGGAWGAATGDNHLENMVRPASPMPRNPYLDYDTVKTLAQSLDDSLESNLPVALNPGMYNLVLMNQDQYLIGTDGSDTAFITVEPMDDTGEYITLTISDATGSLVYSSAFNTKLQIPLTSGQPPYTLVFSKDTYARTSLYQLEYDLLTSYEFLRPKAQKGYGWGGYVLVNPTDAVIDHILLSGYTKNGEPLDSFLGPLSLKPGEKVTVFSSDFPFRNQLEKQDFYGVKIHAPQGLRVLNLSGMFGNNMALGPKAPSGKTIVIPDYPAYGEYSVQKSWGIYNAASQSDNCTMSLYSGDGTLSEQIPVTLQPREVQQFSTLEMPFSSFPQNGWVLITSDNDLSGYEEWVSRTEDANEVLPALVPGQELYLPGPSVTGGWQTNINLINTGAEECQVSVFLYTSDGVHNATLSLKGFEKVQTEPGSLFSGLSGEQLSGAFIKFVSTGQIAGFYTFTMAGKGDYMALPLSRPEDLKTNLVIPHIASFGEWWTAASLCNPGALPSQVLILPYDAQGNALTSFSVQMSVPADGKQSFLFAELFPPDLEVAFVRIMVQSGNAVFGTYGYGTYQMEMMAASIFE